MAFRRTSGSVVCPSCGSLVGVNDDKCYTCGRANPGLWGFGPLLRQLGADFGLVPIVIGVAGTLYLLSLLLSGSDIRSGGNMLTMLGPSTEASLLLGASGGYPVFVLGHWWTVLSAIWLHGGVLHIVFNMMSVRNIAPITAEMIGPARTAIVYVLAGACGFLLSSVAAMYFPALPLLRGAPLTLGASASIFGLIGALVHYGRKSGSSMIHAQAKQWAFSMLIYTLLPGIDSYAHLGGFIGGYALSAFFNPLTPERGDHTLVAIVCLAASVLAVAASFLTTYSLIFS